MNIGIVSLGLIGGSILKVLSEKEYSIFAATRNKDTISNAKQYSSNISSDLNILKNCEVVFVASPINKTVEILDKLETIVNKNTIVLDCASVKEFIMQKKRPYKFIGSHPMAGTENSGFNASFKELFVNAKWVLTPSENITEKELEIVKNIIKNTGADIITTTPKEHDEAVALISHLPLLISQALFYNASDNNLALELASSGFRDMTRLAMSNLEMAQDMQVFNAENIENSLKKLNSSINYIKNTKDLKLLADIKNRRLDMYSKDGKNIFKPETN
jgi:arogenate dehydrogenase (NADP+)